MHCTCETISHAKQLYFHQPRYHSTQTSWQMLLLLHSSKHSWRHKISTIIPWNFQRISGACSHGAWALRSQSAGLRALQSRGNLLAPCILTSPRLHGSLKEGVYYTQARTFAFRSIMFGLDSNPCVKWSHYGSFGKSNCANWGFPWVAEAQISVLDSTNGAPILWFWQLLYTLVNLGCRPQNVTLIALDLCLSRTCLNSRDPMWETEVDTASWITEVTCSGCKVCGKHIDPHYDTARIAWPVVSVSFPLLSAEGTNWGIFIQSTSNMLVDACDKSYTTVWCEFKW